MQSGAGELYDLEQDPHECTNLFDDPLQDDIKSQLMRYINSRPDDAGPIRTQVGMA